MNNVINLFLVSRLRLGITDIDGTFDPPFLSSPGGIFADVSDNSIAHEMGHYFSLPHTFLGGPTVKDLLHPEKAQYVNDEVSLLVGGNFKTFYCDGMDATGDGFCDTPADPAKGGNEYCNFGSDCILSHCSPINDPLGVPYNPDPSLLMSYFGECRNRFSNMQGDQMELMVMAQPN